MEMDITDPHTGETKRVTVPTRQDNELDSIERLLSEFYTRFRPSDRVRISRYLMERFYAEGPRDENE
jgi:hypothetical protein